MYANRKFQVRNTPFKKYPQSVHSNTNVLKAKRVKIIPTLYNPVKTIKRGSVIHFICPFHKENTPSCAYYINTNTWYCFACGFGGDSIEFYMKLNHTDFYPAVKEIQNL